jgi:hypothetical protein
VKPGEQDQPHPQRNEKGQFVLGTIGIGGRKVGARAKLGEDFIRDMQTAWEAGGIDVITRVMADRPQDFLKVVASLLPRDVNLNLNNMDDATDDELIQRIRRLDAQIRPFLDLERASDVVDGTGPETAH